MVYTRRATASGFVTTSAETAGDYGHVQPLKVPVSRQVQQLRRKLDRACLDGLPTVSEIAP